ncbi:MAG: ATP-binding cassette domain-containing protein [Deltaproteobacteria bacterium]|jgi:cell division transport system ATP-binding protein|nr:ATP-binding cassette domain-containing protein [Deltaproteobacteria bacterium]
MIAVRHLSHHFGSRPALQDCTFHLNKGEFMFLTGPSGAGKSTLLRLLFADLALQQGEARVADFNLMGISPSRIPLLRRRVSVVFQDFKLLLQRTVYENILLPLQVCGIDYHHADRRIRAITRHLGLDGKLNDACADISGGEQQRVAVARAFVTNPQVVLADEPTGNLDPELSIRRLMELFKFFQKYGTTMIIATHNPELLRRHPEGRAIRLDEGVITQANWSGALLFQRQPRISYALGSG